MASGDHQNTSQSDSAGDESRSSPLKKPPAKKKAKAGSSKKMTQKEQSERFIETARELGVSEDDKDFLRAVQSILPEKQGAERGKK